MDLAAYKTARTRSFFDLGLTFSVDGDRLAVTGFNQFPPEDRARLQALIRQHKTEIMGEAVRLQDRLKVLIGKADNSRGMDPEDVEGISEEGSQIIESLMPEMTRQIFENS